MAAWALKAPEAAQVEVLLEEPFRAALPPSEGRQQCSIMAVTLSAYISPFNLNILRPPPAARVCVTVCVAPLSQQVRVCVCGWLKTSLAKDSEKVSPKLRLKCAPQSDSQREAEILSTCCNCQVARPTSRRQLRLTNGVFYVRDMQTWRNGDTATQPETEMVSGWDACNHQNEKLKLSRCR